MCIYLHFILPMGELSYMMYNCGKDLISNGMRSLIPTI
jgi:hypothetical protein